MAEIGRMYIDGAWVPSASGATREIINPADRSVIGTVYEGDAADVDKAVAAARKAFDDPASSWRALKAGERASLLFALADKLESDAKEFAHLEVLDSGKPLREAECDVSDACNCLRYYAGLATKPMGVTYEVPEDMQALTVREPIGVCAQIVPWNYPLLMAMWKLAPALAAGNTVVFKPAEITPLTTIKFFGLIEDVGFPKGVANLVLGAGATVGAAMSAHPGVDKIAFTGGTVTGKKILESSVGNLKRVSLELGGKSPNIVFADADFETAVDYALFAIFAGQGQICAAGSRLLLEKSIAPKFIDRLVERAKKIVVGPGLAEGTEMGPLVSERQMEKVLHYIDLGIKEGATLACGGHRMMEGDFAKGFFVEPTIFTDTTEDMSIVKDEIFGPVLAVQVFEDEADAIRMANNTRYGLAGACFTQDGAKALRVIKALRAGITWINGYHSTYNEAPWGGYKESGNGGRELGTYGLEEYTEVKQININTNVCPIGWFAN